MTGVDKNVVEIKVPPPGFERPSNLRIGFLGLGLMGSNIAAHLVNAGFHVTVWNRSADVAYRFQKAGVRACRTIREVVQLSDIIFTCVSDSNAATEVVFKRNGVLDAITANKGYVEITSVDLKTSRDLEGAIDGKGALFLEAPVVGCHELSYSAELVILAAGNKDLFDTCEPMFGAFAKHAFHFGDRGNAAKMNILLSMMVGTTVASLAESMSLAKSANVSQETLLDIVALGPLRCPLFIEKAKAMMEQKFSPANTQLQHIQKDLRSALAMGEEVVQPLPITSATNEVFKRAKTRGCAEKDMAAVYKDPM